MRSSLPLLTKALLRSQLSTPPLLASLSNAHATLPQLLASLPSSGVGAKIRQRRWLAKGLDVPAGQALSGPVPREERAQAGEAGCYWLVTRTQLKERGKHGKAWGRLVWRGEWALLHRARVCLGKAHGTESTAVRDRKRNGGQFVSGLAAGRRGHTEARKAVRERARQKGGMRCLQATHAARPMSLVEQSRQGERERKELPPVAGVGCIAAKGRSITKSLGWAPASARLVGWADCRGLGSKPCGSARIASS